MVKIVQKFLTKNDCYKQGRKITPIGIFVHSTGANNPNLKRYINPDDGKLGDNKYNNDWNRAGISKCVHAFIGKLNNGEVAIYQTLPWNYRGWHGGKTASNDKYIGFEICEDNLKDPIYFNEVYNQAIDLCVYLSKEFPSIKLNNIIGHNEGYRRGIATNHSDPEHWFRRHGKSMNKFRQEVDERLNGKNDIYIVKKGDTLWGISQEYDMTVYDLMKLNDLKTDLINIGQKLQIKGAKKPTPTPSKKVKIEIDVDGYWGTETVKLLQIVLGTKVDGYLSNQHRNSITLALSSGVKFGEGGSLVIRELQKIIGAKVDGYLGKETIRKLQRYLGTIQDGKLSKPSLVVKALQRRLNQGKL